MNGFLYSLLGATMLAMGTCNTPEGPAASVAPPPAPVSSPTEAAQTTSTPTRKEGLGVAAQIKEAYRRLSLMTAPGYVGDRDMEQAFCTAEWTKALHAVQDKDRDKPDEEKFIQENLWMWGLIPPVTPKGIHVAMLDDDTAQATFTLNGQAHGFLQLRAVLRREDGQWRIHTWTGIGDVETDMLQRMKAYLKGDM